MTIRRATATAMSALVLGAAAVTLGGCAKPAPGDPDLGQAQAQQAGADGDTIDLVAAATEVPTQSGGPDVGAADRVGLRARMLRALHATWVTEGANGTVTHQAVRGQVTGVSSTSISVKAKDGFTLTYAVTPDTKVRVRVAGRGSAATIDAVTVGDKALVTGVGATNPAARLIVFHSGTPRPSSSSSPSATS
ncbi:hypothetical protein ACWEOW_05230 [Monashia sp. NPDC004114]